MESTAGERVQGLVSEAWALLDDARPREAALLFGRVLLLDPAHEQARQGLMLARARAGELERELEARLDEARAAVAAGELAHARSLLEDVIRLGGDRDRAHELLDRLHARGTSPSEAARPAPSIPVRSMTAVAAREPRAWWSRTVFATACGLAFAAVTTTVAASWDHLLGRLERRPSPAAYPISPASLATGPAGERALTEARRRLEHGDLSGALTALQDIAPDDPVYPFALQLRQRAESAPRGSSSGITTAAPPAGSARR